MKDSLHQSIEQLKDYDFSGEWKTDIYLDPIAKTVYPFTSTNGMPMEAFHKIDRHILTVSSASIPASVYNHINEIEEVLERVLMGFDGEEWDANNNHIGKWNEDAENALDYIHQLPVEIACYWEASDWLEPVEYYLKCEWESGMSADVIIDSEGWCGGEIDGMCDRSEAIAWLEDKIEEWKLEADEEE